MNICVVLGGASPERNVSVETGLAVGRTLLDMGHSVQYLDPSRSLDDNYFTEDSIHNDIRKENFLETQNLQDDFLFSQIEWMKSNKIDLVFNALHGGRGENGVISGVFEMAGLPFTGSGSAASALTMDKYRSKIIFEKAGILTAKYELHSKISREPRELSFPLVIKPSRVGSSVGLFIVHTQKDISEYLREALKFDSEILIEEYIDGRELTVTVVAGKAYPVVEIVPEGGVYDYKRKYTKGKTQYFAPARISDALGDSLQKTALEVYEILGLENYARIDFRVNEKDEAFCLEANTLPGMTSTSLVPKAAKAAGVDFPGLLNLIIDNAIKIKR